MSSYVLAAEAQHIEILRVLSGYRDLATQLPWTVSEALEPYLDRVAA
jgi:hypothetical protein